MKNMIKLASIAAVALALTQSTQATPISGNIGFTGGVTYNTAAAGTATEVTSWIAPQVTLDSGAFSSVASGTAATFAPGNWTFNSGPVSSFWSVGGFTFNLVASSITSQVAGPNGFVVVNGWGTVSGNGYSGNLSWSFTSQDPQSGSNPSTWTFSASSATVPDGGATVMLLGLALSGAALLKKKLTA